MNSEAVHGEPVMTGSAVRQAMAAGGSATRHSATNFAAVITSRNWRDFVIEAIERALARTRQPTQAFVVDDGSTDGSDILQRERDAADGRVTLICASNGGRLAAFQRGVKVARVEAVCFLDSDDRRAPDYLERMGLVYDTYGEVDVEFTDLRDFGHEDRPVGLCPHPADPGYPTITTYVPTRWYGAPTSAVSTCLPWVRRAIDFPDSLRKTRRTSPDNCLVCGRSVLGACKYYLSTDCVDCRIHGNNAWLSNRSPRQPCRDLSNSRTLIAHDARVAQIDDSCAEIELRKLEFRTRPHPPWFETRHYVRLVMMRRVWPTWRKWERALSILVRGWKLCR